MSDLVHLIPKPENPSVWENSGEIYFLSSNGGLSGYYPKNETDARRHWMSGDYSVAFKYSVKNEAWSEINPDDDLD